jgi:prepilin-type N-terminal cleavage/methylation domain-containing protein
LPCAPTCHCEEPSSFVIARSAATKQSRGKAIAAHPAGPRNDTMRKDENMKRIRLSNKTRNTLQGHSRGFALIEVVIAIALIGLIGAAVLTALSTASLALIIADERATAESLARTQMEYIKDNGATPYDGNLTAPHPQYLSKAPSILPYSASYSVNTTAVRLNPKGDGPTNDDGIQEITVTITYYTVRGDNGMRKQEYILVDYKRNPEV